MDFMFPSVVALPPLPGSLPGRLLRDSTADLGNIMESNSAPMGQDSARAILGEGSNQ
jgi:hypothetical protein